MDRTDKIDLVEVDRKEVVGKRLVRGIRIAADPVLIDDEHDRTPELKLHSPI